MIPSLGRSTNRCRPDSSRSDAYGRQKWSESVLSNDMDQEEADDNHHGAGYAMN
jgi:hypothetical protein